MRLCMTLAYAAGYCVPIPLLAHQVGWLGGFGCGGRAGVPIARLVVNRGLAPGG
jgi:hypothetical protein